MKFLQVLSLSCLFMATRVLGQQHAEQDHSRYIAPNDPKVKEKLSKWQDVKFGLLMHWGIYSQWGIVESWSLCPEDEGWCERKGPHSANWYEYKTAYEGLQTTFNPTQFNPDRWAAAAKNAGMKYVIFTTKHHDGFCMFDSKQTDYKITSPKTPFSSHPKANVTKEILSSFRKEGFMTGTYFSKPDWNTPYYWWPYFPPKDRNVSYDPKKYPEKYQQFKDFTYKQIEELMTGYGNIDILWLDGGWVRPFSSIDPNISWQKTIPYDQDIDMPRIAKMARGHQPGLLVVDRTVTGEFENYVTPEQSIPDHYMPIPWESCMTLGDSWSYLPSENFKPVRKLVHTLVDIVAKNGNLLLNVAPGPDGEWHEEAYSRLEEIGKWIHVNGESIYGTKPLAPYRSGSWAFTQKNGKRYATYLASDTETALPDKITIPGFGAKKDEKAILLGHKKPLKYRISAGGLEVTLPKGIDKSLGSQPAWVFIIQ